jgi:tetratricopeptide (TPR) repeat protein
MLFAAAFLPLLAAAAPPPTMAQTKLAVCFDQANKDPVTAIVTASGWIGEATGAERAYAQQCLGIANSMLQHWPQAEQAFLDGRDYALPDDHELRARLAAMAGNAALADGRNEAALAELDMALADAKAADDTTVSGGVQLDRSRVLVALGRMDEASAALADARAEAPQDPETWLLSATLARRMNDLKGANARIAVAAGLAPKDPAVALEAGVIAMFGGNEEAARKSWQSAIDLAPGSPEAATAKNYLDQIGPAPQAKQS